MPERPSRIDRSIALVGLMGAGKSTVGRRLAKRLGLSFVDADAEIERSSGYRITEIFDRFGEAAFREAERRLIAALTEGPPRVIATGGGAFADEETRRLLLDRSITVWLDADIDTLAARVGRGGKRPLLRGSDPRATLAELAARRNPFYAEAHIRVESGAGRHQAVVDSICRALAA